MSQKFITFLDMDGVMVDWNKSACRAMGVNEKDYINRHNMKKGKEIFELGIFDTEVMVNKFNLIGESFWYNMEKLPWADILYREVKKISDEVVFLTSPGRMDTLAHNPKRSWVRKHYKTDNIIVTTEKHFCANKHTLLIDNSSTKIKKFVEHGGSGIHFPSQYTLFDKEEAILNCYDQYINFVKYKIYCQSDLIKYIVQFIKDSKRKSKV